MKKILLNLYIWPAFLVVSVAAFTLMPLLLLMNVLILRQPMDSFVRRGIRIYGWILVRCLPFMAPVTLEDHSGGFETPVIFVANHSSAVDPYLFGMLPTENAFITTWPFKIPLYNYVMRLAGYINANNGWNHVLDEGKRLMAKGSSLIIWPEGRRSRSGKLARFRNGAFQLACQTGRPIVPICISGTFQLFPPGKRLLTPARVNMIILPPIRPGAIGDDPDVIHALKKTTHSALKAEIERQELLKNNYKITQTKERNILYSQNRITEKTSL